MVKKMVGEKVPHWVKIGKDFAEFLGFKEKNPISVEFLDDGEDKKAKFTDKEGNVKIVDKAIYRVIDLETGANRMLSVTSKRLLSELAKFFPLKGDKYVIEQTGEDFDTAYEITPY